MARKIFILLIIAFLAISCVQNRFIRKQIKSGDLTATWYYYSYITDNSPEYVSVDIKDSSKVIFKTSLDITDVKIDNRNLIIKVFEIRNGTIYSQDFKPLYGYNIILDTSATYEDYRSIPDGKKE